MTSLEKIQKAALARLEAGEDLEHILQDYADYEEELRPILEEASGLSLGALMHSPRPKAKIKAKHEESQKPLAVPLMLAVLVILGAGLFLFLGKPQEIQTITVEPIEATAVPQVIEPTAITVAQVDNNDNSRCSALGQLSLNTPIQQQEAQQNANGAGTTGSVGMGEPETTTAPSLDLVYLSTPSAMPTMAAVYESAPMEAAASTSGSGGSAGVPVDAEAGELGRSVETADMAVVTDGVAAIPTSVASYDERESDDSGAVSEESSTRLAAPVVANQVVMQPLNAGEIDDNADWDTYQEYRRNFMNQSYMAYAVRDLDTTDRQIIQVVDENGLPVLGACVEVYNGESFITASRSYATGLTLFFPNLYSETVRYLESFRLVVSKDNVSVESTLDRDTIGGLTSVTLPLSQSQETVQLDVMFLLDATGSMSDEIAQLQDNILAVSAQLDALPNAVDVRFGLVAYRDRGDEYVTRVYDFTDDVQVFQANLASVQAGGGGDYPESLNEGLYMALNAVNWRGEDAIKLVFLVADAPPHVDYANDADYSILVQDALALGIKIHPIASSGLQPEGEYILRQIGQFTMGHFLFLTYEGGVAGTTGEDRPDLEVGEARDEQGIGDYSVAQLDELVLRLITDEVAALLGE